MNLLEFEKIEDSGGFLVHCRGFAEAKPCVTKHLFALNHKQQILLWMEILVYLINRLVDKRIRLSPRVCGVV